MKEIEEDTNRWKDKPYSWIGRINIVKMTILPPGNLQIQCNLYQVMAFFTELEQKVLKLY